jgi:hypothetical protein
MTAKSTPYLSCHRDHYPAKVPGPVAGWLRQVTQPPFIAGPLCGICVRIPNRMQNLKNFMKRKLPLLIVSLIFIIDISNAQTNCNHKQIIMRFLKNISAPNYKSSLSDFDLFFDSQSEIEIILRSDYLKTHPNSRMLDTTDLCLAINTLLNNVTVHRMIDLKNKQNKNWTISRSYKYGSATIVYVIKIDNSSDFFQIQMANWPDREMCKICDVLDSKGKSIYYSN